MADVAFVNKTATALGLYDTGADLHVAAGMGGGMVIEPDMTSADVLGVMAAAGEVHVDTKVDPTNTATPKITGNAIENDTMTCDGGEWTAFPPATLTYQWETNASGTYKAIAGATGASYTLTGDEVGYKVRCTVTATNPGGSASKSSAGSDTILAEAEP